LIGKSKEYKEKQPLSQESLKRKKRWEIEKKKSGKTSKRKLYQTDTSGQVENTKIKAKESLRNSAKWPSTFARKGPQASVEERSIESRGLTVYQKHSF